VTIGWLIFDNFVLGNTVAYLDSRDGWGSGKCVKKGAEYIESYGVVIGLIVGFLVDQAIWPSYLVAMLQKSARRE